MSILHFSLWEAESVGISFNPLKWCWLNLEMWIVLHYPSKLIISNIFWTSNIHQELVFPSTSSLLVLVLN